jgi:hypothetical protein
MGRDVSNIYLYRYIFAAIDTSVAIAMAIIAGLTGLDQSNSHKEGGLASSAGPADPRVGTCRLRFRIDSVCIIQDSREDWEKEAAQVASVYSNAYCTIAASSSSNGSEGCRVTPDLVPYGPVPLPRIKTDDLGNSVSEQVRVFFQFGMPTQNILQTDALTKRGWTLQERELSSRIR